MSRKKKGKPSSPERIAALRLAEQAAAAFANDPEPRIEDGPSARLFRQMVRRARPEPVEPPRAEYVWSEGQLRRLAKAERQLTSLDLREVARGRAEMSALTNERNTHVDRVIKERAAEETQQAAARQGAELDTSPAKPGENVKPMRRRTGLEWLKRKDRLSDEQFLAGQKYADDYRVSSETPLKSCISETRGGSDDLNGLEQREEAYQRLRAARLGALSGHPGMIVVCDQVCGEGRTIRQLTGDKDAEAQQTETTLGIALDLLAEHYGIKNIENRIRVSHWG